LFGELRAGSRHALERLCSTRNPRQPPGQDPGARRSRLLLGEPHPGDEASQSGSSRVRDCLGVVRPAQQQTRTIREVANGYEGTVAIMDDVQPTVYRRELHERGTTAPLTRGQLLVLEHLQRAVRRTDAPPACGSVCASQQVENFKETERGWATTADATGTPADRPTDGEGDAGDGRGGTPPRASRYRDCCDQSPDNLQRERKPASRREGGRVTSD